MKKEYIAPWAEKVELDGKDIMFTSITLSKNTKGDDDGGNFDELFG